MRCDGTMGSEAAVPPGFGACPGQPRIGNHGSSIGALGNPLKVSCPLRIAINAISSQSPAPHYRDRRSRGRAWKGAWRFVAGPVSKADKIAAHDLHYAEPGTFMHPESRMNPALGFEAAIGIPAVMPITTRVAVIGLMARPEGRSHCHWNPAHQDGRSDASQILPSFCSTASSGSSPRQATTPSYAPLSAWAQHHLPMTCGTPARCLPPYP